MVDTFENANVLYSTWYPISYSIYSGATTVHFDGSQHLSLTDLGATLSEAEDLSVRFRTTMADAIIVATRDDASTDKLQVVLGEHIKRFIVFILQVRPTTMSQILIADLFSGFESPSFQ